VDRSLNPVALPLIYVPLQLLILQVTQGRVLLIVITFIILALLLLRLLSLFVLRHHNLDLKRLLLLRYELG
jgi:hypothetical protein